MKDILLQGALLYDGSAHPAYQADILIRDSRILQVEPAGKIVFSNVQKMDLQGYSISPGWIDVHGHSDASILAAPEAFSKISQGITTEVNGNCGLSAFPICTDEVREHLQNLYEAYDVKLNWNDFQSYTEEIGKRHPAVNLVFLCGHNTLRANILGYKNASPDASQSEQMQNLLAAMLAQGAAGLSTGLLYTPGCFAKEDELLALLCITAKADGVYATHLRNEGDRLEEALDEAISLSAQSGCRLQISHLKTALPRNWHKINSVLQKIQSHQAAGQEIHADRYPYTYSQTSLSIVLPEPFDTMTDRAICDALQSDSTLYDKTLKRLSESGRDWNRVILSGCKIAEAVKFCGMTIAEASTLCGQSSAEFIMGLLREDAPGTMGAFGGLSEENLKKIMLQNWVCCGTDETARPEDVSLGTSHPRGFGSFPRFISLLRSHNIPMEQIIRRITALPSHIFRLKDRGIIAPGMTADLTIFDESELADTADFTRPHSPAKGIKAVFVNGVQAETGNPGNGLIL